MKQLNEYFNAALYAFTSIHRWLFDSLKRGREKKRKRVSAWMSEEKREDTQQTHTHYTT